jgi:ABC-2 type transport system ATP-binding protein
VLARRIGIIDHGRIVAEGTPEALKAEIGRASVEAIPSDPEDLPRVTAVLERFGEPVPGTPRGTTVRLSGTEATLAAVVRALDAENLQVEHLQLHQPSLNDVFLAKTGRSLEGAGDGAAEEEAAAEVVAA